MFSLSTHKNNTVREGKDDYFLKKVILFDLDGTLLDSVEDVAHCCNAVLKKYGLPEHESHAYGGFLGWGVDVLITKALGPADEEFHQKVLADYNDRYQALCATGCQMYSGVSQVLESLRHHGLLTAVVSNKPEAQAREVYRSTLSTLIDAWYGQRPGWPVKPDPCGIHYILEKMGSDVSPIAYVGDTEVDIATGRNANLPVIGVSWGNRSRDFLLAAGANKVVDTMDELETILLQLAENFDYKTKAFM